MKLYSNIAKKISREMMKVIPYNINVMDENGIIIGSGDSSRIGTLHEGAKSVIQTKTINEIYKQSGGVKPGVNEPIIMDGMVIGVVGITGQPDEVRPFSKLVRATAVLLIEQEQKNLQEQNDRFNRETFYRELSYRENSYDDAFIQRGKLYGLDLTRKIQAIIVQGRTKTKVLNSLCEKARHYLFLENHKVVLFTTDHQNFMDKLEGWIDQKEIRKVSFGNVEEIAAVSIKQAESALHIGTKLKPSQKMVYYEELKVFVHLSYPYKESLNSFFSVIDKSGSKLDLIQTLQAYIEESGDMNQVASKLNIHRNTLNYRIDKIEKLSGKNPRDYLDMFQLICGLMWYEN
ncbi:CdaR family transcriptional regulator [Fontibacillus panacisegetis]|nr:sugar diacid recognition domain-containing protein [Fontibacillus panacisegetis]